MRNIMYSECVIQFIENIIETHLAVLLSILLVQEQKIISSNIVYFPFK